MNLNRRVVIRVLTAAGAARLLLGAGDFWNRKPASEWSAEEVAQLMTRSPWAKEVNADLAAGSGVAPTLGYGRGGAPAAPREGIGGAKRREPVTVRWESALPVRDAGGLLLGPAFKDRYVIAVTGLVAGVMDKRRAPEIADMIDQLKAAATLEARGQEPEQPGVVQPAPRTPGTYLFGFSKELLPLDGDSKEILFILQTAMVALKAKFDPKTMIYRGRTAL